MGAEEQSHRFKLKSGNTREGETFAGLSGLITPGTPTLSEITDGAARSRGGLLLLLLLLLLLPTPSSYDWKIPDRDDRRNNNSSRW